MKNYFRKITELFAGSEISGATREAFYDWLTSDRYAGEKEEALRELWEKARHTAERDHPGASVLRMRERTGIGLLFRHHRLLRRWQAAAAVLLLASLGTAWLAVRRPVPENDLIQQFVPVAETSCFTLPDGTGVQMNSRSALIYPQSFTGAVRSVFLVGEASFKVKPDAKHPFVVKADGFQVTALGTEFNVSAWPGSPEISATLLSGQVKVDFDNLRSSVILNPSEQLLFNRDNRTHTLTTPDLADVTAWQRGELVFRGMTLRDIITVLERKYPCTFVYRLNSLKDDHYSFRFPDKASLPEVMDIIVRVVGDMKYRIESEKCYLTMND